MSDNKRCCHYDEGYEAGTAAGYSDGWEQGAEHGAAKQAEKGTLVESSVAACVSCGRSTNTARIMFCEEPVPICPSCDDRASLHLDKVIDALRLALRP